MGIGYGSTEVEMQTRPHVEDHGAVDPDALPQRMYNNLTSMIRAIHHTVNADKTEEIQILTETSEREPGPP